MGLLHKTVVIFSPAQWLSHILAVDASAQTLLLIHAQRGMATEWHSVNELNRQIIGEIDTG